MANVHKIRHRIYEIGYLGRDFGSHISRRPHGDDVELSQARADASNARAEASSAKALIAHLRLMIEKLISRAGSLRLSSYREK
jgi:hypothetical protein